MKQSYEELEEQLNRSRRLCDAALANERVWETTMMEACGEDGPASVAAEIKALRAQRDTAMESLRQQLSALAAENAGLKSKAAELVHEASEVYSAYNSTITEPDGDFMDMQTLQEMQCVESPATDAFLAEVRASAVDEACLKISNAIINCYQDEQIGLDAAATICGEFADGLRKGVQS
ncbi:hypothetical protein UXP22_12735 [Enterobacter hormaechei]